MQLKDGAELQGGKFRIVRVLGQGGFGITYLAENLLLGRMVAIKEFFPKDFCGRDNTSHLTLGTQNNAETVERLKARFLKEARNIAKLDHPGIVKIQDVFTENNTAYYVMDYIDGENLNEMVKRGDALPEAQAVDYVCKVGEALEYIHSRNMTHFDVKPANIMIRRSDNRPILIDFGLSKQYDAKGDATTTMTLGVSHGYSPLELYGGNVLQTFSPQTDVYSLGATLYFLLTGTTPPEAPQVAQNGLALPATISPKLTETITRAMAIGRAKRHETVANFCGQLSGKAEATSQATPTPVSERPQPAVDNEATQLISETSKSEPVINFFKRSGTDKIFVGDEVSVYWSVRGADTIAVNGVTVPKTSKKKLVKVALAGENAITLTASNAAGTVKKALNITVHPRQYPRIKQFDAATKTNIKVGDSVKIIWEVEDAVYVWLDQNEAVSAKGTKIIGFLHPGRYSYNLNASNHHGTAKKTLTINVSPKDTVSEPKPPTPPPPTPQPPAPKPSASGGGCIVWGIIGICILGLIFFFMDLFNSCQRNAAESISDSPSTSGYYNNPSESEEPIEVIEEEVAPVDTVGYYYIY